MADWGHCMHCKYFASPAREPMANEEARCLQRELSKFELVVFGASGCNGYELRPSLTRAAAQPEAIAP